MNLLSSLENLRLRVYLILNSPENTLLNLKMISSPYCALSKVCLRFKFFFVSRRTSQKINIFCNNLHEVNSKFHVKAIMDASHAKFYDSFFSYHSMKQFRSFKKSIKVLEKEFERSQR